MCWLKPGNANYGGRFGAPTFKKFPSKHHRSVMISRDNDVRSRMMEAAWRWQNLGFPTLLGGYGIFFITPKRIFFRAFQHSEIQGLVLLLCALHVFLCKILPPHRWLWSLMAFVQPSRYELFPSIWMGNLRSNNRSPMDKTRIFFNSQLRKADPFIVQTK